MKVQGDLAWDKNTGNLLCLCFLSYLSCNPYFCISILKGILKFGWYCHSIRFNDTYMVVQSDVCIFIYINKQIPHRQDFLFQIETKLELGSDFFSWFCITTMINFANSQQWHVKRPMKITIDCYQACIGCVH